ncbi:hypothetical protein Hanom_Chr09g00791331 [Helianthus anomalus]
MDVAVIDWKDSKFEKDPLYDDFNAPQWIDFSNADYSVDDEAWFCRPDCNHPKTVEDFFRERSPGSSKLQRSAGVSEIIRSGDRNKRDPALKKRGFPSNKDSKHVQDDENHNPNFSTPPPMNKAKSLKEMIKSSAEKNPPFENVRLQNEETPRPHNLFAGRDILNQVTEFCNELKRLAMRTKADGEKEIGKKQEMEVLQETQRMPLLEKYEGSENHNNVREKLTNKKIIRESENSPVALNMKNIRSKDEQRLLQIRINPPSPQCFSANRKATPPTAFGLRSQERGILGEIEGISSCNKEVKVTKTTSQSQTSPLLKQNEAKGLDVFWIFKPCTLSR